MEELIHKFSSGYETAALYECGAEQEIILRRLLHNGCLFEEETNEKLGKRIEEIYEEACCKRMHSEIRRVLMEWRPIQYLGKKRGTDRKGYWVTAIYPAYDNGTEYVLYCEKPAEDCLQEGQKQRRIRLLESALMEGSDDAILVLGRTASGQLKIEDANSKFKALLQWEEDQDLYHKAEEVIPPCFFKRCRTLCQQAILYNQDVDSEEEISAGEATKIFYFRAVPIRHRKEQLIVLFIRDVTKQHREQHLRDELLKEYESYYKNTVTGMGLLWLGDDGRQEVLRSNRPFEEFSRRFILYGKDGLNAEKLRRCARFKSVMQRQITLVLGPKRYAFYDVSIVPVGRMGQGYKFFISCADSTEKMRMEQRVAANLTLREQEIAEYAARGIGNKAIAAELGVSEGTVKKILSNTYKKLNISSRGELIKYFLSDKHIQTESEE